MRGRSWCLLALILVGRPVERSPRPADTAVPVVRIISSQPMTRDRQVKVLFEEPIEMRLALFDLAGRRIGERTFRSAGRGSFVWDLSGDALPSGLYFLVAEFGGRREVRKLLILR